MSREDRSARINQAGARPLWQQVAGDLREEIKSGRQPAGSRLPSETELAYLYSVSRVTIRHAIQVLSDDGLLEVVHGRGTFVAERNP